MMSGSDRVPDPEHLATRYSATFRDGPIDGDSTIERVENFLVREGLRIPEGPGRDVVLGDLLARELEARLDSGEEPRIEEYRLRFPDDPTVIDRLFTALAETPRGGAASPDLGLVAGQLLDGRFRVLELIGQGGLGRVYRAFDAQLRRHVALKEIRGDLDDAGAASRFRLEAEVTGALQHPGIAPIYHLGTLPGGRPYYTMRLISGRALEREIADYHRGLESAPRAGRTLELGRLLRHFIDLCQAVDYAHERGVVHRDLKPSNVMVGRKGRETIVVDWGLAVPTGTALTDDPGGVEPAEAPVDLGPDAAAQARLVAGTPAYMSPEQATGGPIDARTDLYGLGAILFHIISGSPPVSGRTPIEILEKVRRGRLDSLPGRIPDRLRPLGAVASRAMALEPSDRYASARELAEEVERWLADEPVAAYREPIGGRIGRWVRKHSRLVAGAAVAVAVAVSAAVVIGLVQADANAKLSDAYRNESRARERLEAWQQTAFDTIRDFRDVVVSTPELTTQPELDGLRRDLLRRPLDYFEYLGEELRGAREDGDASLATLARIMIELVRTRATLDPGETLVPLCLETERVLGTLAARRPDAVDLDADLAEVRRILGHTLRETGRAAEAQRVHSGAIEALEPILARDPGNRRCRVELFRHRFELAVASTFSGDPDGAEGLYRAAIGDLEPYLASTPADAEARILLVQGASSLGSLLGRQPARLDEAEAMLRRGVELGGFELTERADRVDLAGQIARCQNALVAVMLRSGRLGEARALLREASRAHEELLADMPRAPAPRFSMATGDLTLGELERRAGDAEAALEAYRRAVAAGESLAQDYPENDKYQSISGYTRLLLGALGEEAGDLARAREQYTAAVPVLRLAAAINPGLDLYRRQLAEGLLALIRVSLSLGLAGEVAPLVDELVGLSPDVGEPLARLLCGSASGTVDPESRDDLLDLAISALEPLVGRATLAPSRLRFDPAFDLLRRRGDFLALIDRVMDRAFPDRPFVESVPE